MAINETIGEPIPKGVIGDTGTGDAGAGDKRTAEHAAQIAEIREELKQLRHTIGELAETTARYARQQVRGAAQTAVDRYPLSSIALAALVGYWLAGRRR